MSTLNGSVFKKRYIIHRFLGQGGMSTVVEATDRITNQNIALKQLLIESMPSRIFDEHALLLAREFQVLATLRHPHIVEVMDYGFDDHNRPYFTMEILNNSQTILEATLDQSLYFKINLLIQVLQALDYLHRHGMVHRDIKPSNVLVVDEKVKLVDFGLTAMKQEPGVISGTVAYMAPELLNGGTPSPQTDLFAVGVIAYQMIVGEHPFKSSDLNDLFIKILNAIPNMEDFFGDQSQTVILDDSDQHIPPTEFSLLHIGHDLGPIVAKLLEKDPQFRYSAPYDVIQDLCMAVRKPIPAETQETRDSYLKAAPFVGRETELDRLSQNLADLISGKSAAVLIGGESGVGKSRLVSELRIKALVKGVEVLRGSTVSDGSRPYQLFLDSLAWLAKLNGVEGEYYSLLKALLPDFQIDDSATLSEQVSAPTPLPITTQNIFKLIKWLLEKHQRPTVLILEDLQWARDESLNLLTEILDQLHTLPLLILATYRNDEQPHLPNMLNQMEQMNLERLDHKAVGQLTEAILGEAGHESQLVDWLHHQSEGNVFFLIEVLRSLTSELAHLSELGSATISPQIFAAGMRDIIQQRLAKVPDYFQPMLKVAATLGRRINLAELQVVDPHLNLDTWLTQCTDYAVLERYQQGWQFAHDKLREGILENLTPPEVKTIHAQAALALASLYGNAPEQSARVAYHYRLSGDEARELHYVTIAGDYAFQLSAYQEAVILFERGLVLAQDVGHVQTQIDLAHRSGEAHWRMGAYTVSHERLEEGLTLASMTRNRKGMTNVLRVIGNINQEAGNYIEAVGHLTRSLEIARELGEPKQIADALRSLAVVMMILGKYDKATTYHHENIEIYRELEDDHGVIKTLHGLGLIARLRGDFAQANTYHEQSLAIARKLPDKRSVALALNNLGSIELDLHHFDDAQQYQLQSLEIFKEINDRHGIAITLSELGLIALKKKNLAYAQSLFYDALGEAINIGALPIALSNVLNLAILCSEDNRRDHAITLVGLVLDHPASDPQVIAQAEKMLDQFKAQLTETTIKQALAKSKNASLYDLFLPDFID